MVAPNLTRLSKWMSLVLRHDPARFGVALDDAGWTRVDNLLAAAERARVPLDAALLRRVVEENDKRRFALSDDGAMIRLAASPAVRALVEPVLGARAFPVRGILFDKTPDANWKVAWHQDLSIAVRERRDAEGFGPWSEKAGVTHVQPPASVLERMVTVRIHLDDCGPENGPVYVVPGSHRHGRLDAAETERWRERVPPVAACATAGGALLMRPLLLHASSPSTIPAHRRVIHIEFAADDLPGGLDWYDRTFNDRER